jgi:hypothetical protein
MAPLSKPPDSPTKPGPWTELALTLPIFLTYQLGVVFLDVRNATDIVTGRLLELSHGDRLTYLELTGGVGLATAAVLALLGRGQALRVRQLVQIALEGAAYAAAMGAAASWVVGKLFAGLDPPRPLGLFTALVMSLGAGFYEELVFRAALFGVGVKLLNWLFSARNVGPLGRRPRGMVDLALAVSWGLVCSAVFSGMHYTGSFGEPFELRSFIARTVLGLALTAVYATRGFAAAVWTHALYDLWVLVV